MINQSDLKSIIEALFFVADEPLTLKKIAETVGEEEDVVKKTIYDLQNEYLLKNRGIQLQEVAGGFRLYTHPGYAHYVEKLVLSSDQRRLTQAALETLAIVAYKQPITKSGISVIRGVNADAVLSSLQEKGLVKEIRRDKGPGQPILYGTTKAFLEKLGLRDISDLSPLEDFAPDEETKRQIRENLWSSPMGEAGD